MLIVGIITIGVGGLLFWLSKKQADTSQELKSSSVVPIRDLQAGTQAEIQGIVTAQNPLRTPFGQRDCVYYEYEVEKEVRERNAQGQMETDWETVEQDDQQMAFTIDDGTGQVAVKPDGATLEARDLGEQRFRRGDRFNNSLLQNIFSAIADVNTRVTEKALLAGEPAYVYGLVRQGSNGLEIAKGDKKMIISYRSEEEVEKSTARTATVMKVLGIIGLVGGVILVIYSFI